MSLLGELKRRKVFQVAAVYAVVAWLIVQVVGAVKLTVSNCRSAEIEIPL